MRCVEFVMVGPSRLTFPDHHTHTLSHSLQVRHIRVIASAGGFQINKADDPCSTIQDLITQKMGEKIKSKLAGGATKETVLLKVPYYGM
jgi:hypothetical protein